MRQVPGQHGPRPRRGHLAEGREVPRARGQAQPGLGRLPGGARAEPGPARPHRGAESRTRRLHQQGPRRAGQAPAKPTDRGPRPAPGPSRHARRASAPGGRTWRGSAGRPRGHRDRRRSARLPDPAAPRADRRGRAHRGGARPRARSRAAGPGRPALSGDDGRDPAVSGPVERARRAARGRAGRRRSRGRWARAGPRVRRRHAEQGKRVVALLHAGQSLPPAGLRPAQPGADLADGGARQPRRRHRACGGGRGASIVTGRVPAGVVLSAWPAGATILRKW